MLSLLLAREAVGSCRDTMVPVRQEPTARKRRPGDLRAGLLLTGAGDAVAFCAPPTNRVSLSLGCGLAMMQGQFVVADVLAAGLTGSEADAPRSCPMVLGDGNCSAPLSLRDPLKRPACRPSNVALHPARWRSPGAWVGAPSVSVL